jgi:hypothetical protein
VPSRALTSEFAGCQHIQARGSSAVSSAADEQRNGKVWHCLASRIADHLAPDVRCSWQCRTR